MTVLETSSLAGAPGGARRAGPDPSANADAAFPWWRGAVIYQIYPRSFLDTNGDGIGDLKGVAQRLDYVASLGVDAVWLSPFFTSPMKDFGYDVSDYKGVDRIFGTLKDFDDIVERAHGLGLKVIIDQVYSHTSDAHEWFQMSRQSRDNPKANWYVWADAKPDGTPPSNWQSVFGGPAWSWDARRGQYYLHNFLSSQPDLNAHNREVQDALLDVARFWLDRGVDGFRLDAINFAMHDPSLRDNPPAPDDGRKRTRSFDFQLHRYNQSHTDIPRFLERVRALTDAYEGVFTVAEVGGPNPLPEMKAFTAGGVRLDSAYNFDFLYADQLRPERARSVVEAWRRTPGEGWPSWAFSNHDAPRAVSRWAPPEMREGAAKLYAMALLSLRGNAFIYQGEELGLPQATVAFEDLQDPEAIANWPLTLGRDGARTPMPWRADNSLGGFSPVVGWLPVAADHLPLSVDAQERDPGSTLHFMRRLIALRRETPALRHGDSEFLIAENGLLAFKRRASEGEALCVFNLSEKAREWTAGGRKTVPIALSAGLGDVDRAPSTLPPFSGFISIKSA